ncbi:MAG: hypothetical protein H0V21_10025 [Rubrobacter sp.]|nr:hypothetical protein [Rubrobacter sp.]
MRLPNTQDLENADAAIVGGPFDTVWKGKLDALRKTNSLCVLTCHSFLSGRLSRVRAIEDFVEFARGFDDVRFSRADRLAI